MAPSWGQKGLEKVKWPFIKLNRIVSIILIHLLMFAYKVAKIVIFVLFMYGAVVLYWTCRALKPATTGPTTKILVYCCFLFVDVVYGLDSYNFMVEISLVWCMS